MQAVFLRLIEHPPICLAMASLDPFAYAWDQAKNLKCHERTVRGFNMLVREHHKSVAF
jgi:hypothetical protein